MNFVSTKQRRIAKLAKQSPQMAFTSLAHHIDISWMHEAYRRTRKDGATGVDDVTAAEYEVDLEGNLQRLLDRAKSGTYRAPPVRRVHIPKGSSGETRPIGIPTLEDKILQRAVVMLLEPIFEHDFLECSYGYRPKRSAHQALVSLQQQASMNRGAWILEVDIRKFFDTLDHQHLHELLQRRIRDGVVLRLIHKWLHAGVMEDGNLSYPEMGSPQGGVISPLLANIYLHYVLDEWFHTDVLPRLEGRATMLRYADDFVVLFERESDAQRFFQVLPKRFGKFGLTIHPDKTRLIPFQRPLPQSSAKGTPSHTTTTPNRGGRPGTFDFLGFTHFWARSRRGNWIVKRKTARSRFIRAVRAIDDWCRKHRHQPIPLQHQKLNAKLRGHFAYFGMMHNFRALQNLRHLAERTWHRWLNRRHRRRTMIWAKFQRLLRCYPLAPARINRSALRFT